MRATGRLLVLILAVASFARAADPPTDTIEPAELTRRPELIGKPVVVEDRVRLFQFHPGAGYSELILKRTPVVFRLPPRLRPDVPPKQQCVRVSGTLVREDDRWFCDVSAYATLPDDLTRINDAIAALRPADYQGRAQWARWAERRGKEFHDTDLIDRARELDRDAIRIEADRPAADAAKHWLALAERARDARYPPEESPSLAHRGLRERLTQAKTSSAADALLGQVLAFFPNAPRVAGDEGAAVKWRAVYARDPAAAYRSGSPEVRAWFDHQLWADAVERLLELKAAEAPGDALSLAERAESELSDRPQLAARLFEAGMNATTRDLGRLRQRQVEQLAKLYREKLRQPDRAIALIRDWLAEQRNHRLQRTDAEGRVALARQYESMLGDQETAIALLREAWKIDPDSKEVAEVFRRKGYKKVNDEWIDARRSRSDSERSRDSTSATPAPSSDLSLKGCTPDEVRTRMGSKPSRIVRSATQSRVMEQWIYYGDKKTSFINFRYDVEQSRPLVVSFYSVDTHTIRLPTR